MDRSNFSKKITVSAVAAAGWVFLFNVMTAQPAKMSFHREPYFVDSGFHDGGTDSAARTFMAYRDVIQVPGAPWLRLLFRANHLGEERYTVTDLSDTTRKESYIIIRSLEDGGWQYLNAASLRQWRNTSAFFNGDAVEIELHVAPRDIAIFFEISEVMVGEWTVDSGKTLNKGVGVETLCDGDDDRADKNDPAVGRILSIDAAGDTLAWCTGWIASNGAHLTAGHCEADADEDIDVLEFNVQPSDSSGNPVFSHPDHQYSVNRNSINHTPNPFRGNDWAVFDVHSNSNTGKLPVHAYGGFYRMTRDLEPPINQLVRVTGYGIDETPAGSGGGPSYCPNCNEDSQTLQTDTGEFRGEDSTSASNIFHNYRADTEGGNSGSPVINTANSLSIGVHTHGGCTSGGGANSGTSFENDALERAIQTFPGPVVRYVDKDHPVTLEDTTVFRPYDTVIEGVNSVPSGGIVSIVTGFYNEPMTINTAMTIEAPVGVVTIGASSLLASTSQVPEVEETAVLDPSTSLIPDEYSLSNNYPNPFNPSTTIQFALPTDVHTTLVVYDILGREIIRLVDSYLEAGYHSVTWDGRDPSGRDVASGIYIVRMATDDYQKSVKITLLR